jgi:hypothetical protein
MLFEALGDIGRIEDVYDFVYEHNLYDGPPPELASRKCRRYNKSVSKRAFSWRARVLEWSRHAPYILTALRMSTCHTKRGRPQSGDLARLSCSKDDSRRHNEEAAF